MIFNAITKDMKIDIVLSALWGHVMFHAVLPDLTESHPIIHDFLRFPPSEPQTPETNLP
jgi:hypothetical protein